MHRFCWSATEEGGTCVVPGNVGTWTWTWPVLVVLLLAGGHPVASGADFEVKEQVRQAIDIADLVGRYIPLRRQGKLLVGLCPWHDDTRPSLQVNPQRQTFRCWVCDIGGDVFSFLMRIEGLSFPEALAQLAQQAGVPLRRGSGPRAENPRQKLHDVLRWAIEQYHRLLFQPAGSEALEYLHQRHIHQESIRRFRLGYAPPQWDWLVQQAARAGIDSALLQAAGLAAPRERGGHYDRFRGRVLFPIYDAQGRPVGLGGRILPQHADEKTAKYVNTPETALFAKSRLLFGLDQARDALRRSGVAVVVEGYTDCIMAHQLGQQNVVAVLGTAMTEAHLRLLRPLVDEVVLVLDGDEAGRRRSEELLELFATGSLDLRVCTLPAGLDPCDFLLQRGVEAWQELLAQAPDALEHKYHLVRQALGPEATPGQLSRALDEVLRVLARVARGPSGSQGEAQIRLARLLTRLAHVARVDETVLRRRLGQLAGKAGTERTAVRRSSPPQAERLRLELWQRELLEVMLLRPEEAWETLGQATALLDEHPLAGEICRAFAALRQQGIEPTVEHLLSWIEDEQVKNLLVALDESAQAKAQQVEDLPQWTQTVLQGALTRWQQRHAVENQRRLALTQEEQQQRALFEQLLEQKRRRDGIRSSTEG